MPTGRRRGRRPKSMGDTRALILTAARAQFAQKGLDRTTWRDIARAADVDPALVLHYFESKEELFFEAIRESIFAQMEAVFANAGGRRPIGEQLVGAVLDLWDSPDHREALVALVRAGVSNERVAQMFRGLFETEIPSRIGARLRGDRAEHRVGLVATQLMGLVLARYVVGLPSIASAPREVLESAIGPTLTRYLTAPAIAR